MTTTDSATNLFERRQPHLRRNDQSVLDALQSTDQHPTAIELYEIVRRKYPRIGRATVYRALQRLEASGLALSVGRDMRGRHYDARTARHDHAICSQCGRLFDLTALGRSLPQQALEQFYHAAEAVGLQPESWEMRIHGRCANCRKEQARSE